MAEALRLFKEGKSKAEIGAIMGKDKKQVAKIMARAIRAEGEKKNVNH